MKKHTARRMGWTGWIGWVVLAVALVPLWSVASNINPTNNYVWAENAGWVNFLPAHGGVTVHEAGANGYLSGYAWGENIGWIKLGNDSGGPYDNTSATDWGVNLDAAGNLSGYAWGENIGWIKFNPAYSPVTVDGLGNFDGYAWSENLGWIHVRNDAVPYGLAWEPPQPSLPPPPTASGATSISESGFTAKWTASPGATNYLLDVSTDPAFGSCVVGYQQRSVGNVTTYEVTGLTVGQTYYYRVRAQNANGTSIPSAGAAVILPTEDVTIQNLQVGASSGTGTVEWAATQGVIYDIYRSESAVDSGMNWMKVGTVTATSSSGAAAVEVFADSYFRVVPTGQPPNTNHLWGAILPSADTGFTLMSPGIRSDRKFDGALGANLAAALVGNADGTADKVHILEAGDVWRTLWLDEEKVWRESDGAVSTAELPAGGGFFLERTDGASGDIVFTGPVGNDDTGTYVLQPGFNLIGLSEGKNLPLQATFQGAQPVGGAVEETADQLVFQNPNGSWRRLMYVDGWGAPYDGNWFDLGTFQIVTTNEVLQPGAAYYYLRSGAATSVAY